MSDALHEPPPAPETGGHSERRTAKRVAVELFAREHDGERLFVHPATNLSASGIFLESHSYSQRNAIARRFMELEFELPETEHTVSVRGEVIGSRRVRGYSHGLAVKFINLDDVDYALIDGFVEQQRALGAAEGPTSEAAPTDL